MHLYQGFWYGACPLNGILSAQRNIRALNSDIPLVTNPKSGTTWLKAILFALMNRSRYSEPDRKSHHPLLEKNPHVLVPVLELKLYLDDPDPDLSPFTVPRLFATHLPFGSLPESVADSKSKLV